MEEIDYKRSIELLNRDVDACLEIIERWKKNSASEQEVEAIKAIKNLFPNAEYVERIKNSNIVGIGNSENGWIADINNALFPSLKPGNSIDIDDALAM
jgi:hypothetical protein